MPLLFGIWVYCLFAVSQNLGLIVLGRVVSIPGILTWTFPLSPGLGWTPFELFPLLILIFVPIQFVILSLVVSKLIRVVRANVQPR